jgi:hypothetical protein
LARFGVVTFDCGRVLIDFETIAIASERELLADRGWNTILTRSLRAL